MLEPWRTSRRQVAVGAAEGVVEAGRRVGRARVELAAEADACRAALADRAAVAEVRRRVDVVDGGRRDVGREGAVALSERWRWPYVRDRAGPSSKRQSKLNVVPIGCVRRRREARPSPVPPGSAEADTSCRCRSRVVAGSETGTCTCGATPSLIGVAAVNVTVGATLLTWTVGRVLGEAAVLVDDRGASP